MTKDASRFTLRLPEELKNKLAIHSRQMGISLNALVIQLLWQWINEAERR